MRTISVVVCVTLAGIAYARTQAQSPADDRTRFFPAHKVKFTLPGDDWAWEEGNVANGLCSAINNRGWNYTITYMAIPKTMQINDEVVLGFEKGLYIPGQLDKRGGRFLTFKGQRCYQAEGVLANGRTVAARVMHAHGFALYLMVIGDKEPIEKEPEFESIMNQFDFLTPPQQSVSSEMEGSYSIAYWMGRIAGTCLAIALLYALIRWIVNKLRA